MNVVFWSLLPGQSAVSANALAVAMSTAIDHKVKCSLLQLQYENNGLFNYLFPPSDKKEIAMFENTGIDALIRSTSGSPATQERVEDCSFSFVQRRLNIFTPSTLVAESVYSEALLQSSRNLFESLNLSFKLNFVDVPGGMNKYSKVGIDNADVLVVCLPQSEWVVAKFFETVELPEEKKVLYLFGDYDKTKRFNTMKFAMKYRKKVKLTDVLTIPHCIEYADAMNESTCINFYMRNVESKKDDVNRSFVDGCKDASSKILRVCGYSKSLEG